MRPCGYVPTVIGLRMQPCASHATEVTPKGMRECATVCHWSKTQTEVALSLREVELNSVVQGIPEGIMVFNAL